MSKKWIKTITSITALAAIAIGFQNCGEKLNLSEQTGSANPASVTAFVIPVASEYLEGNNYTLSVNASNISHNINDYSIQWTKDGADLTGQTTSTLTIINLRTDDAGEYRARLTLIADITEIEFTNTLDLVVTRNTAIQVFTNPSITYLNNVHSLVQFGSNTEENVSNAFCKHQLGAQATAIDRTVATTTTVTEYYAFAYPATSTVCDVGIYSLVEINDICIMRYPPTFGAFRYQSITCNPNL